MLDRLIAKIGAKAFGALAAAVTALVSLILHEIDKYFTKKRYFAKGKQAAMEMWDEQERFWKKKVEDIQKNTDLTLKEKMKELQAIKKAFKEYVTKQEGKR